MAKKTILGINAFAHDTSIALIDIESSEVIFAISEERFSNQKHDGSFPYASLEKLCKEIEIRNLGSIEYVAFNADIDEFMNAIKNITITYFEVSVGNEVFQELINICDTIDHIQVIDEEFYPLNYFQKFLLRKKIDQIAIRKFILDIKWNLTLYIHYRRLKNYLRSKFSYAKIIDVNHHNCHIASSFYCSGFEQAVVLSLDGQGERETINMTYAHHNTLNKISTTYLPHSIGLLYMHLTSYLGFQGDLNIPGYGDEYKVMGMSAYGNPVYAHIFKQFASIDDNGRFQLHFDEYLQKEPVEGCNGHYLPGFTPKFYDFFGPKRLKNEQLTQKHFDIASSFQYFIEDIGVGLASFMKNKFPYVQNICISGGVGLNGLMNMRIYEKAGFKNIFIQPASGDDGTALGAAMYVRHQVLKLENNYKVLKNAYLGFDYDAEQIETTLKNLNIMYSKPSNIHEEMAKYLHAGKIVTRFYGRSEFGPRALGHRSILANPSLATMKDEINSRIKHRESFRPFAPACLLEETQNYFDIDCEAPYMLLICKAKENMKYRIPAVVHDDGTARVQTVSAQYNSDFYETISAFYKLSNIPVLVNTSFNVNGETIVETPLDAIESFLFMQADVLAIGNFLVKLEDNKERIIQEDLSTFLTRRKNRYLDEYFSKEQFLPTLSETVDYKIQQYKNELLMYQKIAQERLQDMNVKEEVLQALLKKNNSGLINTLKKWINKS